MSSVWLNEKDKEERKAESKRYAGEELSKVYRLSNQSKGEEMAKAMNVGYDAMAVVKNHEFEYFPIPSVEKVRGTLQTSRC